MKLVFLLCAWPFLALPVLAEPFAPRSTDTVLSQNEMQSRVIGASHEFFDGGTSFFSISGSYSYTYTSGEIAYGTWSFPEDQQPGVICTQFTFGFERCDMYVRADGRLVLLTYDGLRLPVRSNSADG